MTALNDYDRRGAARLRAAAYEEEEREQPRLVLLAGVFIVASYGLVVFGAVGVWLLASADPFRAVGPFAVAAFFAWCVSAVVRSGGEFRQSKECAAANPTADAPLLTDEN